MPKVDNVIPSTTQPLLVRHAVTRQPGQEIPGRYCDERRMWVIDSSSGARPLIEASRELAELQTKTKVVVESDDDIDIAALQMVTKTDVQYERDDESRLASDILELKTKTEVAQEQDKQDCDGFAFGLLELMTKTAVHQEQDKQDFNVSCTEWLEINTKTLVMTEQDDTSWPHELMSVPLAARLRH